MDTTNYRFLLCVFDGLTAKDLEVSVKFKLVMGNKDKAAGMVWRHKDKNNYYVVRANALIYKLILGRSK